MKRPLRISTILTLILLFAWPAHPATTRIYPSTTTLPFLSITAGPVAPATNDGAALGTTTLGWSDLHLATGAVINWANAEVTLTETDANTLTLAGGQWIVPSGSAALPSLAVGASNVGFYAPSGGLGVVIDGTEWARFNADLQLAGRLVWGSSIGTVDSYLGREATAVFQLGNDAATPVAQTFKGPDGLGTNVAGGGFTAAPGRGTGSAAGGTYYIATSPAGGAGGSQNALVNRFAIDSAGAFTFTANTGMVFGSLGTATRGIDLSAAGLSGATDYWLYNDANNYWRADGKLRVYAVGAADMLGVLDILASGTTELQIGSKSGIGVWIGSGNDVAFGNLASDQEFWRSGTSGIQVTVAKITAGSGTGVTVNDVGSVQRLVYKVTVTYAALSAAALTADKLIATIPAKQRLVGIIADTTTKYIGGAVTAATLIVGKTAGGNQYIVSHDVYTAAITRGLADADLGTSINRANAIQGGDLPSFTSGTGVSVRLTTVDANTDALTQGSTTYYLVTELMP